MQRFKHLIFIRNIIIVIILLFIICFLLETAPYYKIGDTNEMTNIIINNNNVTLSLKRELIIKDDIIFLSLQDISNFFDNDIYFEPTEKRIITTSNTKVASLLLDDNNITINSNDGIWGASAFQTSDEYETIYWPFS